MVSHYAFAAGGAAGVESASENKFPATISFSDDNGDHELALTGFSVRKKFFLNIYSMAHYLQETTLNGGENVYEHVLDHSRAKQITMVFMRDLTATQIKDSLIKGIKTNSSEDEFELISPHVEAFTQAITQDVKEGDEFILRWMPDGSLVSLYQGQLISTIKSDKFAKTLWAIWFGEHSVVDRNALVKHLVRSSSQSVAGF